MGWGQGAASRGERQEDEGEGEGKRKAKVFRKSPTIWLVSPFTLSSWADDSGFLSPSSAAAAPSGTVFPFTDAEEADRSFWPEACTDDDDFDASFSWDGRRLERFADSLDSFLSRLFFEPLAERVLLLMGSLPATTCGIFDAERPEPAWALAVCTSGRMADVDFDCSALAALSSCCLAAGSVLLPCRLVIDAVAVTSSSGDFLAAALATL